MELNRAMDQIAEIHDHLTKSEVYRGFRSLPVALTGLLAVAGGLLQPWVVPAHDSGTFVLYWLVIAAASLCLVATEIAFKYVLDQGPFSRRMTRKAAAQFLPCLAAGAVITGTLTAAGEGTVSLLPGLWALLFSLGIFAARPNLPRATGWVGLFYLVGGTLLLRAAFSGASLEPWGMASVFGTGQLFSAATLYWNLERRESHAPNEAR